MTTDELRSKLQLLAEQRYRRDGTLPVLDRDSPAWKAWRDWRQSNGLSVNFMDRQDKWTVPTEYPPVDMNMALQEVGGKTRRFSE